jgi:hypothetical protein
MRRKPVRVVILLVVALVLVVGSVVAFVAADHAPKFDFSALSVLTARCRDDLVPVKHTQSPGHVGCVPRCVQTGAKPCIGAVEPTLPPATTTRRT